MVESKLAGNLSTFPLTDIIQLFIISQKIGELRLLNEGSREGASLYFSEGTLVHATCNEMEGKRAFEAILKWKTGSFTFIPDEIPLKKTINQAVHVTLLDSLTRLENIEKMRQELPPDDINLFIVVDLDAIPPISTEIWKVLALVNGRRTIARICQKYGDELDAKRLLLLLLKKGLVSAEPPGSDWRRLIPYKVPTSEVQGDRPVPPRLRSNLLLRSVDGETHLEDIRRKINVNENDLMEDVKLLYELHWIRFSTVDEKVLKSLLTDL